MTHMHWTICPAWHIQQNSMAAWGRKYCRSKVLTILEGGYHMVALADSVEKYLASLAYSG